MQTRLLGGYGSGAGGRREPLTRSGGGAETIRSNLVVRHITACRPRHFTCSGIACLARPQSQRRSVAPGILDLPVDPSEAVIIPHYEWQYHYAGRHAHWEGHQVLIMAPTQSARR